MLEKIQIGPEEGNESWRVNIPQMNEEQLVVSDSDQDEYIVSEQSDLSVELQQSPENEADVLTSERSSSPKTRRALQDLMSGAMDIQRQILIPNHQIMGQGLDLHDSYDSIAAVDGQVGTP